MGYYLGKELILPILFVPKKVSFMVNLVDLGLTHTKNANGFHLGFVSFRVGVSLTRLLGGGGGRYQVSMLNRAITRKMIANHAFLLLQNNVGCSVKHQSNLN